VSVFRKKSESGARHAAAGVDGPEIRVRGYHISVTWWQRRLIIRYHKLWRGAIEITPEACVRTDYSFRDLPDCSELLLSIRLQAGKPSELTGVLEIAFPLKREGELQLLVQRVNAEIPAREERTARPPGELLAQAPALPPQDVPPPPRLERERSPQPSRREPPVDNPLATTVAAMVEARTSAVAEPASLRAVSPAPEPLPRDEPPRVREESPRLRQLTFVQAPDDDEWITFRPLRTADDVRAPMPVQEHE
jgi:hypothetical protein